MGASKKKQTKIAHNLDILLMNSNCFAIFFSSILVIVISVQISISKSAFILQMVKILQQQQQKIFIFKCGKI